MNKIKKLPIILSLAFCFAAASSGCSLAVPEGESGTPTPPNVKTEFEDGYCGQMLVIYDKESNYITSQTMGDETCVAWAYKYDADYMNGAGLIDYDISGDDYMTYTNNLTELLDGGTKYTKEIELYLNAEGFDDRVYAFDLLSYDENGEIQAEHGMGHTGAFDSFESKLEITQTITTTVNGEATEKYLTFCVIMKAYKREVGTDWTILQYDDSGSLIKKDGVTVDTDEDFQLEENCSFVVYEETLKDGSKKREINQLEHDENYINFYYEGGFGLLTNKPIKLVKPATE